MTYRVRSSSEINWVYQRNVQFLEDYLRSDWPIRPEAQKHVRALVTASPGIRLSEIVQETEGVVTRDDLFAMIAIGTFDIDISSAPLTEPEKIRLRLNQPKDECLPASNGSGPSAGPGAAVKGLLPQMGPAQVAEANRRLRLIQAYEAKLPLEDDVSERTVRHWLHRYRHTTLQDPLMLTAPKDARPTSGTGVPEARTVSCDLNFAHIRPPLRRISVATRADPSGSHLATNSKSCSPAQARTAPNELNRAPSFAGANAPSSR